MSGQNADGGGKEYEVGYKKFPKHTRFQPGQSGNPSGRRKGAKGYKTLMEEWLLRSRSLVENGKAIKVSNLEAMVMTSGNDALRGKARDRDRFMSFIEQHYFGDIRPPEAQHMLQIPWTPEIDKEFEELEKDYQELQRAEREELVRSLTATIREEVTQEFKERYGLPPALPPTSVAKQVPTVVGDGGPLDVNGPDAEFP